MREYACESEKVTKFPLNEEVLKLIRAELEKLGEGTSEVLDDTAMLMLIPKKDGSVFFGIDSRARELKDRYEEGEVTEEEENELRKKMEEIRNTGLVPRALVSAAIFIGDGCSVMWSTVGGVATVSKLPCKKS